LGVGCGRSGASGSLQIDVQPVYDIQTTASAFDYIQDNLTYSPARDFILVRPLEQVKGKLAIKAL
jgi:hypothetical protein